MDNQPPVKILFPGLPEGTVTFLFTDIEGSTQLLDRLRDRYAVLLADQRHILREVFTTWNGHEVDTQGDAFFVAFSRATQAVEAAVEVQRNLADHTWPEGVAVRVRMGIHTGEPWSGEEGYVGMDVHRAARIAHVGHGGQVLLSETTTALVRNELPAGVSLCDLGRHLLKDIHRPERICQLLIEGLRSEFPLLNSLEQLPAEGARLPRKVGKCPYRGLSAFQEMDAPFYFGREVFIDALEQAVHTKKLVAVIVGSSGSGKSSALFAGLLPRLRRESRYQFVIFRPGNQPFYALAGELLSLLDPNLSETDRLSETRKLAEKLLRKEVSLRQVIDRIYEKSTGIRQILLVVDQFEELYTMCTDTRLQKAFIDELLSIVEKINGDHAETPIILMTMRADFMGQALAHRPLADALQEASILMGPMTRLEQNEAIEKPAEMQGAAFEAGLVERILDDVGEKPGNLPLLEFTLTQLWDQQTDGWLTHASYESIGCVEGALATYADQVFSDLEVGKQENTQRAMVQLVQPGEGTEDTRRIATREELGDDSWQLIQYLANRRLVVTGRDAQGRETAEVVHEALIQKWGRFREWMDADRAFRAWQEHLRSSLRLWQESKQDEGALLSGAPLAVAQNWMIERGSQLNLPETGYIQASLAHQAQVQKEKEQRRQRTILALVFGLVVVAVFGVIALFASQRANRSAELALTEANTRATAEASALMQRQLAEDQANLATSRELAAAAISNMAYDQELAVLLALQAWGVADTQQAEEALHRTIQELRIIHTLEIKGAWIGLDWSSDGKYVAASGDSGAVVIDPESGNALYTKAIKKGMINRLTFSPDGSMLVLPSEGADPWAPSSVSILDADTGQEILSFIAHDAFVQHASFNYEGTKLATASGDGTIKVWDLSKTLVAGEGQSILSVTFSEEANPWAVWFSPDGAYLATANYDGTIHLLDAESGKELWQTNSDAFDLTFSPDSSRMIISGSMGMLDVQEVSTGKRLSRTYGHTLNISSLSFSPDGQRVATGCKDGTIKIWAFYEDALSPILTLGGHKDQVSSLAFSPDGNKLASGGGIGDGTIRIWNISPAGGMEPIIYQHLSPVQSVAISPDGTRLASGTMDGSGFIWDTLSGNLLYRLSGQDWMWRVTYSPDGALLATASWDGTLKLWDTATGTEISTLAGSEQRPESRFFQGIMAASFSPDGERLVTAGGDGSIRLWDVAAMRNNNLTIGEELLTLVEPDEMKFAIDAAFSQDGRWIAATIGTYKDISLNYQGGIINVWDAGSHQLIWTLNADPGYPYLTVSFTRDGGRLAAGDVNGQASIWTLPDNSNDTPEMLFKIKAGNFFVMKLNFSPDGTQLAMPYSEGMGIWDANTGERISTLPHPGSTFEAVYSLDGKYLVTSGGDGAARLFFMDIDELIAMANARLTRSLTQGECRQYLHQAECQAP